MKKYNDKYYYIGGGRMKNWDNLDVIFKEANSKCNYLILRNFEDFYDDVLLPGHDDIDVLCASKTDRKTFVDLFDAVTRVGKDNGIHYKFLYKNTEIALDIRTVGDGYYDIRWQRNMLKNKVLHNKGFYIMSDDDYFFSLIYHAIYQKNELSNDYLYRLRKMRENCEHMNQEGFERLLYGFMTENKYYYTYTEDESVIKRFIEQPHLSSEIKYPLSIWIKHRIKRSNHTSKKKRKKKRIIMIPKKIIKNLVGNNNYVKLSNYKKKIKAKRE